jgi:hypothetical protein
MRFAFLDFFALLSFSLSAAGTTNGLTGTRFNRLAGTFTETIRTFIALPK